MVKVLRIIALVLVGAVFMFSGFVKAVDPFGGAVKFADYFNAFGLNVLVPFAMPLSIFLAAFEFLIGIHLVLNLRVRIVAWPTLVLAVFFTLLTLYIAIVNPVTDCGCFGDALKLTNWETFFKNVVLLPLVIFIFVQRKNGDLSIASWRKWGMSLFFTLVILSVSWVGIKQVPIIDFRPYKVGTHLPTAMAIPADAEQPEYDTRFILEKDGVRQEFGVNDYPYTDSTWVFVDSKTVMIKEGYQPKIQHFSLHNLSGEDVTQSVLNNDKPIFLLISPKLEKADVGNIKNINRLNLLAVEKDFGFYAVTSSLQQQIQDFDIKLKYGLEYLMADETELKTISRANPGLLLLYRGTIIGKWNVNEIRDVSAFANPLAGAVTMAHHRYQQRGIAIFLLLLIAITTIFYKHKQ